MLERERTETVITGLFQPEEEAPGRLPHDETVPSSNITSASDTMDREAWLRLAFVGLAASRCQAILNQWKDPLALMEAARQGREAALLATPGVTPTTVQRLREAATRD